MVDFWDPEIEALAALGRDPGGRHVPGREAVLGWMKEWAEAWEEIEYTPEEFTEAANTVVVGVLYEGRGKGSGVRAEGRIWYLFMYPSGGRRSRGRSATRRAAGSSSSQPGTPRPRSA